MDLNKIYSGKRSMSSGPAISSDPRTEFLKDFDRIIFSSPFRRLQNKTQVFPLPGSVFVHNRLTHSLEVASVGRSLGAQVGEFINEGFAADLSDESKEFYKNSLYNVISSACLCHDIGNPAFGHSGEDAIASFFLKNEIELRPQFTGKQWSDLINFEGNANAIRILTQKQNGKTGGSFRLTYSTLAAIAKYPCESIAKKKDHIHRKKFGFFQPEKPAFIEIAEQTMMIKDQNEPLIYFRHPFVWLVEAADDICYNIIDLEDAHRLGIISYDRCRELLQHLLKDLRAGSGSARASATLDNTADKNDAVSYLRAMVIHELIKRAVLLYRNNFDTILKGRFTTPLFDLISAESKALQEIISFSRQFIYNHRSVVEIENAGYNVMYELLSLFIPPTLKEKEKRLKSDKKALELIPSQFIYPEGTNYEQVLGVLDYVSGMTDNYATDLYRKIKGIEIGMSI